MKDKAIYVNQAPWHPVPSVMQFDMTQEEFDARLERWNGGENIQQAFPMLNADEREFIMTGIGGLDRDEWDKIHGISNAQN